MSKTTSSASFEFALTSIHFVFFFTFNDKQLIIPFAASRVVFKTKKNYRGVSQRKRSGNNMKLRSGRAVEEASYDFRFNGIPVEKENLRTIKTGFVFAQKWQIEIYCRQFVMNINEI
jgi:hypothetical protein